MKARPGQGDDERNQKPRRKTMMKTAKELVDQINAAKLKTPHGVSDEIDMDGVKELETIDLNSHRWYNMGTVVFSVGDEFFGVHGPVELKSESMGFSD
ncbi:MAG: hypothetical protein E4G90_06160, partial [Gemmatimonadales bacterium]